MSLNFIKLRGTPALLTACLLTSAAWGAKKPEKTLSTSDGRPIRKVLVHAYSKAVADATQVQLQRDTCLTPVTQASDADAVLNLSVALPAFDSQPTAGPNPFARPVQGQTPANKDDGKKTVSLNCSSDKNGKSCAQSSNIPAGDIADLQTSNGAGGGSAGVDVSLLTTGGSGSGSELWAPKEHSKQVWTDQLRAAAGCPVCPGEHFNRQRDKSYRQWIEQRCKSVLSDEPSNTTHK